MYFTIGADVEVFGMDKSNNHVALCGKIGGTKEAPKQIPSFPKGFMVQEDNVSLEFNIPPSDHVTLFSRNIEAVRKECERILNKMNLSISPLSSYSFSKEELSHPNALVFGCEPDYNAWTKVENKKPSSPDKSLRTCGGHVHVGTGDVDMLLGIRMMDLYLGVPSILLDDNEASMKRRELYGKAGAMRPKPYGFEYRVLSNFWIFDKKLVEWVYHNTHLALMNSKKVLNKKESSLIQECINTSNKELAKELINKFGVPLTQEESKDKKVKRLTAEESILKEHLSATSSIGINFNPIPHNIYG